MLLKLAQSERVDVHQRQNGQTERHEHDIEHDRLLAGALPSAVARKLSIANWVARRKEFISFRVAANEPRAALRADQLREVRADAG
jgi:hypothetical protein